MTDQSTIPPKALWETSSFIELTDKAWVTMGDPQDSHASKKPDAGDGFPHMAQVACPLS